MQFKEVFNYFLDWKLITFNFVNGCNMKKAHYILSFEIYIPDQETHNSRSLDKVSRRAMLAVVDYLRRQKRWIQAFQNIGLI